MQWQSTCRRFSFKEYITRFQHLMHATIIRAVKVGTNRYRLLCYIVDYVYCPQRARRECEERRPPNHRNGKTTTAFANHLGAFSAKHPNLCPSSCTSSLLRPTRVSQGTVWSIVLHGGYRPVQFNSTCIDLLQHYVATA